MFVSLQNASAEISFLLLNITLTSKKFKIKLNFLFHLLHSHKKWKDSLATRAVLLIFLLELEITGLAVQRIHQNSENDGFVRNC